MIGGLVGQFTFSDVFQAFFPDPKKVQGYFSGDPAQQRILIVIADTKFTLKLSESSTYYKDHFSYRIIDTDSNQHKNAGLIAAIVVPIVAVIAIVAGVLVLRYKRKSTRTTRSFGKTAKPVATSPSLFSFTQPSPTTKSPAFTQPSPVLPVVKPSQDDSIPIITQNIPPQYNNYAPQNGQMSGDSALPPYPQLQICIALEWRFLKNETIRLSTNSCQLITLSDAKL
jgi:hypothetical protein